MIKAHGVQVLGCVLAWAAMAACAHAAKSSKLEDCSIKPILGAKLAQAQDDWGIELEYRSDKGFDPSKLRFPVYGHWCGPNHPLAGQSPAPYDQLDALCMAHDKCYERSGYSDCSCDLQLVTTLRAAMRKKEDWVRCRKNGKWTTERNPFYIYVEHHFTEDMSKRGCGTPVPSNAKGSTGAKGARAR